VSRPPDPPRSGGSPGYQGRRMEQSNPYDFKRAPWVLVLYTVAFLIMLPIAFLDFIQKDYILGTVFLFLAVINLMISIFHFVSPFSRIRDEEIVFYLTPVIRKTIAMRSIADVKVVGKKAMIRLNNDETSSIALHGMDAMEKDRLVRFLSGVAELNARPPGGSPIA
jgi:hypothetical protein